jgi:hypothetical protein
MRAPHSLSILLLAAGLAAAPPATAQGTAAVQNIETSIRAAGMGGATTGVGWGEPGPWGNPAALARTRGIAWLAGNTQLVPELLPDVTFESRRYLVGGAGVGISLMGEPVSGVGRTRLDSKVEGTDPFGNPVGGEMFEQVEGWGVGVSPLQMLDAFRLQRDREAPQWSQRADVSLGYQHKQTEVMLAPGVDASADNFDWGVQAQFAVLPGDREARQARLELAAGYAVLNADTDSQFDFAGFGLAPSARMERAGASVHASLPLTGAGDDAAGPWGWWFATVPRALDLGFAYDRENLKAGDSSIETNVDHVGFEVSVMGVLTGRMGYVNDPDSEIQDMSFGFGVHLPVGPWASLGYDWASVPVASGSGLDPNKRHGFAVWLHPVSWWRSTRE